MNSNILHFLDTALCLAQNAIGLSSPNPRVGCVIVHHNEIIGQGCTQAAGQAHAEIMAIRDAGERGMQNLAGSTFYVTLEPCSHHGRTPPCAEALIAARPAKVVVACLDPNPQVAGRGVAMLQHAGIAVEVLPREHPTAQAAHELNIGFMTRMERQRVFTRMKWAQSADGKTALPDGRSQWISGEAARLDGHRLRARADVLVTGIGTVLADNPQLNVRGVNIARPPVKCVLDTWARLPVNSRLFDDGATVILACADLDESHPLCTQLQTRIDVLQQAQPNLHIWRIPLSSTNDGAGQTSDTSAPQRAEDVVQKRIDAAALWQQFYTHEFNEIHVEAGATLNGTLLGSGLTDEIVMYLAPRVVGAGIPPAWFDERVHLDDLHDTGAWQWHDVQQLGADVKMVLRKK